MYFKCKSPEVTLWGWRGYNSSIDKTTSNVTSVTMSGILYLLLFFACRVTSDTDRCYWQASPVSFWQFCIIISYFLGQFCRLFPLLTCCPCIGVSAKYWLYEELKFSIALQYFAWVSYSVLFILFAVGFSHIVSPQAVGKTKSWLGGLIDWLVDWLTL